MAAFLYLMGANDFVRAGVDRVAQQRQLAASLMLQEQAELCMPKSFENWLQQLALPQYLHLFQRSGRFICPAVVDLGCVSRLALGGGAVAWEVCLSELGNAWG